MKYLKDKEGSNRDQQTRFTKARSNGKPMNSNKCLFHPAISGAFEYMLRDPLFGPSFSIRCNVYSSRNRRDIDVGGFDVKASTSCVTKLLASDKSQTVVVF